MTGESLKSALGTLRYVTNHGPVVTTQKYKAPPNLDVFGTFDNGCLTRVDIAPERVFVLSLLKNEPEHATPSNFTRIWNGGLSNVTRRGLFRSRSTSVCTLLFSLPSYLLDVIFLSIRFAKNTEYNVSG